MGRRFIPNSKPVIFPISMQSSRPSNQCVEIFPFVETLRSLPSLFIQEFSRRVIRAWWSSRSSKPLPRHLVSGGGFDSYPLRQSFLNFLNPQAFSLNFPKGGDYACRATKFES